MHLLKGQELIVNITKVGESDDVAGVFVVDQVFFDLDFIKHKTNVPLVQWNAVKLCLPCSCLSTSGLNPACAFTKCV